MNWNGFVPDLGRWRTLIRRPTNHPVGWVTSLPQILPRRPLWRIPLLLPSKLPPRERTAVRRLCPMSSGNSRIYIYISVVKLLFLSCALNSPIPLLLSAPFFSISSSSWLYIQPGVVGKRFRASRRDPALQTVCLTFLFLRFTFSDLFRLYL